MKPRRVSFGARGLAKHVIAVGIAALLHPHCTVHRGGDGFPQYKLPPHFLHRARHRVADHRLPHPLDCAAQHMRRTRRIIVQYLTRQHQRPGGGIDQRRGRFAQMPAPVTWGDFVFDQRINRVRIRYAQQRFGQTHQRNAFFRRQAVFSQENLHQPRCRAAPHFANKLCSRFTDGGPVGRGQYRIGGQTAQYGRLTGVGQRVDFVGSAVESESHGIFHSNAL